MYTYIDMYTDAYIYIYMSMHIYGCACNTHTHQSTQIKFLQLSRAASKNPSMALNPSPPLNNSLKQL